MSGFDERYLYAVGRTRSMENGLLTRDTAEKLTTAENGEEALKILSETVYGRHMADLISVYEYESVLLAETESVYAYLKEVCPQPYLADFLLCRYDVHNLKVMLKARYQGGDFDYLLTPVGVWGAGSLKTMLENDDFYFLHPILAQAVHEIEADFDQNRDPQRIDIILDKAQYALMSHYAKALKSRFVCRFLQTQIDMVNLLSFVRCRAGNLPRNFYHKIFIPGGVLSDDIFDRLYEEDGSVLAEKLSFSGLGEEICSAAAHAVSVGSTVELEKAADNVVGAFARTGKYQLASIEPLVAYALAKETEIKTIRMIMVAKINGIPTDALRERLRISYV